MPQISRQLLGYPGDLTTVRLKANLYFPTQTPCVRKYCDAARVLSPGVDGASARLPDEVKAVGRL